LWVVQKLVARHGGTVGVESAVGHGATFTVCWPRTLAPDASLSESSIGMAGAHS
jgi:signal transduction histidine kinase